MPKFGRYERNMHMSAATHPCHWHWFHKMWASAYSSLPYCCMSHEVSWTLKICRSFLCWYFLEAKELIPPNEHWHLHISLVFGIIVWLTQNQLGIFLSHRQGCIIATRDRVHSYFVMHVAALSFVELTRSEGLLDGEWTSVMSNVRTC